MIDVTGLDVLLDDRAPDGASSDMTVEGRRRVALDLARLDAGLSVNELFVAYFAP